MSQLRYYTIPMIGSIVKRFVLLLSICFISGDSGFWDFSVGDIFRTLFSDCCKKWKNRRTDGMSLELGKNEQGKEIELWGWSDESEQKSEEYGKNEFELIIKVRSITDVSGQVWLISEWFEDSYNIERVYVNGSPESNWHRFPIEGGKTYTIKVVFKKQLTDMHFMFMDLKWIEQVLYIGGNTSGVTNMIKMFCECSNLRSLDLSRLNTSNVENMCFMFSKCNSLVEIKGLFNFNTEKVADMSRMFEKCSMLKTLNLSSFSTNNVTNMNEMFYGCKCLTNLNLSNFNTNNVTNMNCMFSECSNLTNLDLSHFNTNNVTNMREVFRECKSLTNLDLSSFNTNNVTNMNEMFYGCKSLTNLDLSGFNTNNVTDVYDIFHGCNNLPFKMGNIFIDKSYNLDESDDDNDN